MTRTTSDEIFLISFQSTKKQTNKQKKETGNVNRKSEALVGREPYFLFVLDNTPPPHQATSDLPVSPVTFYPSPVLTAQMGSLE